MLLLRIHGISEMLWLVLTIIIGKMEFTRLQSFLELFFENLLMNADHELTQKELATTIGKSERTIKTRTVEMQEKGLISRENGKRNGRWIVLKDGHKIQFNAEGM